MAEQTWDTIIAPPRRGFKLDLAEVWNYRDLLGLLVKRDIVAFYKQTILGPLWIFIQPLFTMTVYMFVFGRLAGLSTTGLPGPIFYLTGITFWTYFAQTLTKTATILRDNQAILGKVYFPRVIMPLSLVLSNMFRMSIQFGLLLLVAAYYAFTDFNWTPSIYIVVFPVLVLLLAMQSFGLGMIISALTTKYRDLALFITFGIQLLMYATPVVYPYESLSGKMATVLRLNPATFLFEGFRMALFGRGEFDWMRLAYSLVVTIIIVLLGYSVFKRVERNFVDTI